ncbi:MAG: fumarylacetoacetate hydrolase family protein [Pirellulales bacterium]
MQLVRYQAAQGEICVGILADGQVTPLALSPQYPTLAALLEAGDPAAAARSLADAKSRPLLLADIQLLAPIDQQEVWAAGVTYKRSRTARMEESQGAASFYDKVYVAPRPELFMKATPHRVVGPGQPVRIRYDAKWNVPEPELALAINSRQELVGFTIGNDMSSRDIEGENPLYLPQAKVYNGCCALGPCITLADGGPIGPQSAIKLAIQRGGQEVFGGETSVSQLARTFDDLIQWLCRENSFPTGVFLLTGTGIVPKDDFTLQAGDMVSISIDGIGTLTNPVVQSNPVE